ncbi:EAL domain-containing protein [Colwellia sp. E150_009]|jgi:EAL domain-containing protein (putative c-di-GMP-specific phosphodiesterase class I)/GGDEF domain-containing protein
MYTFPQLLLRNIALALIFIASISVVSFIMLSSLIQNKSQAHILLVDTLAQQFTANENENKLESANTLLKTLKKVTDYKQLTIYDISGEKLVQFINKDSVIGFSLLFPAANKVTPQNIELTIEYQLNFTDESILVLTFIVLSLVLSLFLVTFATTLSSKRYKTMFNIIGQQIKNELALINNTNITDKERSTTDQSVLEIPELKKGVDDIKMLMKSQLKNVIDLEQTAYIDALTKLDNRGRFIQFYENNVVNDSPVKFGVLVMTRCSELQTINQIHGYHEGDNYIARVAELIKKTISIYPDGKLFRLNSSDFASILPNIKLKDAEKFAQELTILFNEYQLASDLDSVAYSGLVAFNKTKPLGELLALADTGVSIAQTQAPNSWYTQTDTDILQKNSANYGNQNWRQEIESVIDNQRITLLLQPIQPSGRNNKVYGEVLARFLNSNNEMLPTASFIAMAEKLDQITAIDKLIVETTLRNIVDKNMLGQSFGINISPRSISDEHFIIWLERRLLRDPKISTHLVFEISEYGLQQNIKTSKRLIDMLHRVGSRVTVERFGIGLTSFKFFRDLTPDYIKMDSSYTRDIDDDKNNQYFLRLMVDLAHRLSINVLAESVESQEEKHTLEKLFIDGCQGFYIGKPHPL